MENKKTAEEILKGKIVPDVTNEQDYYDGNFVYYHDNVLAAMHEFAAQSESKWVSVKANSQIPRLYKLNSADGTIIEMPEDRLVVQLQMQGLIVSHGWENNWVSVETALPEKDSLGFYLCFLIEVNDLGISRYQDLIWFNGKSFDNRSVSHWQSLPPNPETT